MWSSESLTCNSCTLQYQRKIIHTYLQVTGTSANSREQKSLISSLPSQAPTRTLILESLALFVNLGIPMCYHFFYRHPPSLPPSLPLCFQGSLTLSQVLTLFLSQVLNIFCLPLIWPYITLLPSLYHRRSGSSSTRAVTVVHIDCDNTDSEATVLSQVLRLWNGSGLRTIGGAPGPGTPLILLTMMRLTVILDTPMMVDFIDCDFVTIDVDNRFPWQP